MYGHHTQWPVKLNERGVSFIAVVLAAVSLFGFCLFVSGLQGQTSPRSTPNVGEKLAQRVARFDNHDAPLIPTLLRVAAVYSLPMGIEKVTPNAEYKPMEVTVVGGTVAELLNLCVRRVPGYTWAVEDEAVDVFGQRERRQPSNLFNLIVPSFEAHNQTIDDLSGRLKQDVIMEVLKPRGIISSDLGTPGLQKRRLSVVAQRATVRQLLNRLVALDGESVWLARVPPACVGHLPQAGLWVIIPHSVLDPSGLLDFGRCEPR